MLKSAKEEDFALIKEIATGRLSPENISSFFLATLIFSFIMTGVPFLIVFSNDNSESWLPVVILLAVLFLLLHILITLVYFNKKVMYKFQRVQAYVLMFLTLSFSLQTYLIYFALCQDRGLDASLTTLGITVLCGGILFLVSSLITAINKVKKGHFRANGLGLFHSSKGWIVLQAISILILIAAFLPRFVGSSSLNGVGEVIIALFLAAVIQYTISFAWAEFFLLAYCKHRFTSFRVPKPKTKIIQKNNLRKRGAK